MTTIRWGIIGVGNVTEIKSGPGFQHAPDSELVAVMRRNGDLAADFAQRHGVPKWYDDGAALINDPEVDAVYIATPPHVHKEYTLMAAKAGKPVYVEKPMALNHAECQDMVEACRAADVPLFVAYYRRALPRFLKIKELVDSGAIGDVRFVTVKLTQPVGTHYQDTTDYPWRVMPEVSGGGLLFDVGSHMLDFVDFVLGPIQSVSGHAANLGTGYPAEDTVSGSFVFESGVHGVGLWSFSSFEYEDRTEITGTQGKVVYSCFNTEPVELVTADGIERFAIENPPHIQQPLIETINNALRGEGECPSTGESGARTSWVLDQLTADYYRNR